MEIRPYNNGDEKDILNLFEKVFKKKMSPEYWNWRFKNNPFTDDILIHLMWEDQTLIGQYALSPMETIVENRIEKTALAMTLMTHPDYQGKGVFAQLGQSLHADLKHKFGYKMIYAFPNNQTHSHYGFVKNLNWKDIAIIPMLSVKVPDLRFKLEDSTDYRILENFEEIEGEFVEVNKSVRLNKTKKFLNWRYIENPSAKYTIIETGNRTGLAVYKVIESFSGDGNYEIDFMEIQFNNDVKALISLLNAILFKESDKTINSFNIWKSIFSEDQIWFEKLGFKINSPLNYLSYLSFQEAGAISDFKNWEIGMGYSDVF